MSEVSKLFFKSNKIARNNMEYAPTKSLCDENGEPLKFTLRPFTTEEDEALRERCTKEVQIPGKAGAFRPRLQINKYLAMMAAESIAAPDLRNAELQDSYGVKTAEELLKAMVDDPGEYNRLILTIQNFNGSDVTFGEEVEAAKN